MSLEFGKLNFYTSFEPASAFPLDARSYFESYEAAVEAAASAKEVGDVTTKFYYGQNVAVVENGVATMYIIQPDNTLAEVGGKVDINENVFAHDEDGKLNLFGFAEAVAGAQLMKVDGKLAWVKPDQTTVEGLQATVKGLEERMTAAEGNIEGLAERVTTAEGDIDAVEERATALEGRADSAEERLTAVEAEVEKKANAADVYTKEQTNSAIATAVSEAAHLQRTKVDSVEAIDVAATGAEKTIFMVPKEGTDGDHFDEYMVIDGAVERVGDWSVDLSDYAKTADVEAELANYAKTAEVEAELANYAKTADVTEALLGKVDIVEGSRLMVDAEGTKLAGIEEGAQVNKIETVDESQFAIDADRNLTLLDITMGKVTGLIEALDGKVDASENARLMLEEEGIKLAGIESGAQVNIIDAVSPEFTIADGKTLTITEIEMSKVTGLPEALAGKVDAVEGKGLSTNDLTDELLEKLNASQANVLEIVKVNGVALEIADDKSVDIVIPETPIATAEVAGIVKSAEGENKVSVAEDGSMEVNSVNINKLVQTEGDVLIMNGGSASSF